MKKIILAALAITLLGATMATANDQECRPQPQQSTGWYFWSYLPGFNVRYGELYPDLRSCGAAMVTFATLVNPVSLSGPPHAEKYTIRNLQYMTCMPQSSQSTADLSVLPSVSGGAFVVNQQGSLVFNKTE
jgi:hypothetical protein